MLSAITKVCPALWMMARLVSICGVPIEVRPAFRLIPLTPTNALLTLKFWNAETVKLSRVEGGVPRVCPPATNRSTCFV